MLMITFFLQQKDTNQNWPRGEAYNGRSGTVPYMKLPSPSRMRHHPGTPMGGNMQSTAN